MKYKAASKKGLCTFLALSMTTSAVPVLALAEESEMTDGAEIEEAIDTDETEEEKTVEGETPAEDEAFVEGETPAEDEAFVEGETPAEDEASVEDETPVEDGVAEEDDEAIIEEKKKEEAPLMTLALEEDEETDVIENPEAPEAEEREGLYFDGSKDDGNYALTEEPISIPDTVEIWVKLDEGENRRQIIMNNYLKETTKSWGLEVNDDNTLRYWENVNGGTSNGSKDRISYKFTDVNICTGEWTLISVVRNKANSTLDVYINGEYKTSGSMLTDEWSFTDTELSTSTYFGTDLRKQYWLAGEIGEVRMFGDARTADEIKAYYDGTESNADDLEHCWDFGDTKGTAYENTTVKDTAGSNDIITEGFEVNTENYTGLVFDYEDGDYVQAQGAVTTPATVEVRIKLDSADTGKRQTIMNNYGNGGKTWGLEVTAANNLRLWEDTGVKNDIKFTELGDICDDQWKLISLVRDSENKKVIVYIDGVKAAEQEVEGFADATLENWLCFGSDYHTNPTYYLNGEINEVRMWSDVRTAEEIAEYATKTVKGNEAGLAHAWSFASVNGEEGSKEVYSDTVFPDKVKSGGYDVKAVGYPYDPNVEFTVKFNTAGASVKEGDISELADRTQKTYTKVEEPKVTLERGNSEFTGWYKDAACTTKWDFENDTISADTTIYAGFKYNYVSAELGDLNGATFSITDQLCAEKTLDAAPLTFEATVKLDKDLEGRGGVICGNYVDLGYYNYSLVYVSFEVAENGQPRLYWKLSNKSNEGTVQSVVIPGVDLRQDEWVHVAMTFDTDYDEISCYINGELVYVAEDCTLTPKVPTQALKIGGDYRGTGGYSSKDTNTKGYNEQYFKGEIANVSIWSDTRTAADIKADFDALKADGSVPFTGDTLMASWKFDSASKEYKDMDLTDDENEVYKFVDWLKPEFAEGDYTMIALPDTQFLSQTYPDIYKALTQWIAENKDKYNIAAVMHMGDMVNTTTDKQFANCQAATDILDESGIPWMPMQGNHDVGTNNQEWDSNYTYDEYSKKSWFVDSSDDKTLRQTCWKVTAGGRDYLILSLGWNPTESALSWAEDIVKNNPDKNVIVTAHAYMYADGTLLDDKDMDYPGNMDGGDIWDKLGKYPNVVLGMGGHIGYPDLAHRTDLNGAGKEVTSILCDAQGIDNSYGLGMMMMLTFHKDSNEVNVNWYSVDNDQLFRDRNQFTFTVPHVGETEEDDADDSGNAGDSDNTGDSGNAGDDDNTGDSGNAGDGSNTSSGSSSSKSSSSKKYEINTDDTKNGEVKVSATRAKKGSTVTVTVTPEENYELKKLVVTDAEGNELTLKDLGNDKYSFVMPKGKVDIDSVFEKIEETEADETDISKAEEKDTIILTIDQIAAKVFGETVINDVAPVIRNERTMLPARFVAEALGAKVTWNDTTKKVTIATTDKTLEIYVGSSFAFVDNEAVMLDAPAFIENGRTYLPVRFIAEGLGAAVQWDADTQEVTIIPGTK